MQKVRKSLVIFIMVVFAGVSILFSHLPALAKPQSTCPVLGGNIDKSVYADYQGKRVFFCCKGCDDEFKKNPEKYMKKMKEEGVTPEAVPGKAGK